MRVFHPGIRRGGPGTPFRRFRALVSCAIACGLVLAAWSLPVGAQQPGTEWIDGIIAGSTPAAIVFMLSVLVLKVTAFVLGYLIVRLGHDTMIKGVSGQIDFGFSGSGIKAKLKSASPGALFVLMGSAIIIWGLTVEKPMKIKIPLAAQQEAAQQKQEDPLRRVPIGD
ncbi:MAG: hypothetical protein P1P84_11475 [Deferrisomatales bacterium]|nr:hypothetical protein [Deferrisomatales bacterium]